MQKKKLLQWSVPDVESTCRVDGFQPGTYHENVFINDEVQVRNAVTGPDAGSGEVPEHDADNGGNLAGLYKGTGRPADDDSVWIKEAVATMVHILPTSPPPRSNAWRGSTTLGLRNDTC